MGLQGIYNIIKESEIWKRQKPQLYNLYNKQLASLHKNPKIAVGEFN